MWRISSRCQIPLIRLALLHPPLANRSPRANVVADFELTTEEMSAISGLNKVCALLEWPHVHAYACLNCARVHRRVSVVGEGPPSLLSPLHHHHHPHLHHSSTHSPTTMVAPHAETDGPTQNQRFNDPGVFCEGAFGMFCPIYA